ncbi:hypothetical protein [Chitinimonas sp. JJ19]|uniref:hypothetical protein n=1 Tax=Chitinimonas sp. JJ19 TaxID=3109352 RepID=UPI002FFED200
MQYLTPFQPPEAFDMLERGFTLPVSPIADDSTVAFLRYYPDGKQLAIAFELGSDSTISVKITDHAEVISDITIEGVISYAFQSWDNQPIMRLRFEAGRSDVDLRIHYDPLPTVVLSLLRA